VHRNTWNSEKYCEIQCKVQSFVEKSFCFQEGSFTAYHELVRSFEARYEEHKVERKFFHKKVREFINKTYPSANWSITVRKGSKVYKGIWVQNNITAVLKTLRAVEDDVHQREATWMQSDQECLSQTRIGYTYAAFNPCLGNPPPIKIGATMKDSPYPRLKELSQCLPQSFELIACVPSTVP
jgi:hypothetical protein